MAFIADTWFTNEKEKVIIRTYSKTIGHAGFLGHGDWYIGKLNKSGWNEYLWDDGLWHDSMQDYDFSFKYFFSEQAAIDCAVKYGYDYKLEG